MRATNRYILYIINQQAYMPFDTLWFTDRCKTYTEKIKAILDVLVQSDKGRRD